MLRKKRGHKLPRTPICVPRLVQQHARTSGGLDMVPRKSMCSEAVCMPIPARPLVHTRCCVFVWVAMVCPVLWAGALELRDTLDAVFCAVRDWGMRNIWFLSVSPWFLFAYASGICSNVDVQWRRF
jgi:hypothetical protein